MENQEMLIRQLEWQNGLYRASLQSCFSLMKNWKDRDSDAAVLNDLATGIEKLLETGLPARLKTYVVIPDVNTSPGETQG